MGVSADLLVFSPEVFENRRGGVISFVSLFRSKFTQNFSESCCPRKNRSHKKPYMILKRLFSKFQEELNIPGNKTVTLKVIFFLSMNRCRLKIYPNFDEEYRLTGNFGKFCVTEILLSLQVIICYFSILH